MGRYCDAVCSVMTNPFPTLSIRTRAWPHCDHHLCGPASLSSCRTHEDDAELSRAFPGPSDRSRGSSHPCLLTQPPDPWVAGKWLARKDGGPVVLDTDHGPPVGLGSVE